MRVHEVRRRIGARGKLTLLVGVGVLIVLLGAAVSQGTLATLSSTLAAATPGRCPVGDIPAQPAYDPSNHYLYVPNQVSHNVSILTIDCNVIGNVTLAKGSDPLAAVFNPSNNDVYVSGGGHSKIYVIHDTTLVHTISSSLIHSPWGMVYDPAVGGVIVADYGSSNITAIVGMTPFHTTPVGGDPIAVAYDPYENQLLVSNSFTNNVTIVGADTLNVVGSIPVGADPQQIAFDSQDSMDYVANVNSDNVSVISLDTVVSTISLSVAPVGIAFDQKDLDMYVTSPFGHDVVVIHALTEIRSIFLASTWAPVGITFDPQDEQMVVTDTTFEEADAIS